MNNYYFTFGQTHLNPDTDEPMKDYWIRIKAQYESEARAEMMRLFGTKWAFQYTEKQFRGMKEIFPKGEFAFIDLTLKTEKNEQV